MTIVAPPRPSSLPATLHRLQSLTPGTLCRDVRVSELISVSVRPKTDSLRFAFACRCVGFWFCSAHIHRPKKMPRVRVLSRVLGLLNRATISRASNHNSSRILQNNPPDVRTGVLSINTLVMNESSPFAVDSIGGSERCDVDGADDDTGMKSENDSSDDADTIAPSLEYNYQYVPIPQSFTTDRD